MYNFNYVLFGFDILVLGAPFVALDQGYPNLAQFFVGFALMWIFINISKRKVNLNRYKWVV